MYKLIKRDGNAKRGEFHTVHGVIQTPVFMNVGTAAAIKGAVSTEDLQQIGTQVELSNTYHLHVRPGDQVVKKMGGLHKFMNWHKPILTDSGGFQVFSLSKINKITSDGVTFRSHIDGSKHLITPEKSMEIQESLGSDIMMAFDECSKYGADEREATAAMKRTLSWLDRCKKYHVNDTQMLFPIVQGNMYKKLRLQSLKETIPYAECGFAIGGLSVGEPKELMYEIMDEMQPLYPEQHPRYLMGVGTPSNIIEAVARGVDFFDCVMPARNARHARLFTWEGAINLKNAKYITDDSPIDPHCDCPVCRRYSRAYIRHLFVAEEMLAMRLSVMHNLYFYNKLMEKIRQALDEGRFEDFRREYSEKLGRRI